MPKIVGIIHARMKSSRLPGKVLLDLKGRTVFYHHIERMRQCKGLDSIYLATSVDPENKPLIDEAKRLNIPYYCGLEEDVLERLIAIADLEKADAVIRCGCDKPLFSFEIIDQVIDQYQGEDYVSANNIKARGINTELFSTTALKKIHQEYQGEFITNYVKEYPHLFRIKGLEAPKDLAWKDFRLAMDTPEDYQMIKAIYDHLYEDKKPVPLAKALLFLDAHPEISNINRFVEESKGNSYGAQLDDKPIFSIYQKASGKYVVKNRIGENVSYKEFQGILEQARWE